jgi:hypothetical protein
LGRPKRIRVYQFQFPNDGRSAIFAAWQQRDEKAISLAEAAAPCLEGIPGGTGSDKDMKISGGVPPADEAANAGHSLKVGALVRFAGEVQKYVVKAVSGAQVMVKSLLSGAIVHTYARRLELADGGAT